MREEILLQKFVAELDSRRKEILELHVYIYWHYSYNQRWILRVKFCLCFRLSPKWDESLECSHCVQEHFWCSRAVLGAHLFAVMWCDALMLCQGLGQRGVLSVTPASSALSFHFLLESLWAEPGAGSKATELFCCLWLSVKSLFLKGSRGVGLWFSVMHKAACGRTSEKILR